MSNQFTTDDLRREIEKNLDAFSKEFMGKAFNPVHAIQEQAKILQSFQERVTKQIGDTRSLLERSKAFLQNPKAEGIKIVKDGLRTADQFFAKLFKTLTTDVGKIFQQKLSDFVGKVAKATDKFLKAQFNQLFGFFKRLERSNTNAFTGVRNQIGKIAGQIADRLGKTLSNWGKSSGLLKVAQGFPSMLSQVGKNSQALSALKDLPKSMGTILSVVKMVGKILPIIGAFVDLKWKNDVTNKLNQIERQASLDSRISDKQFNAVMARLSRIEASLKGSSELGAIARTANQTLSEVRSLQTSARQGFGQLPAMQGTLNSINTKVGAPQQLTPIDYNQVQAAAQRALSSFNPSITIPADVARKADLAGLAKKSDVDVIPSKIQTPTPIDYSKVQQAAQQALSTFKPTVTIPDDVARKADLVNLARRSDVDLIPSRIRQPDLTSVLAAIGVLGGSIALINGIMARRSDLADLARRSDVDAIPGKIKPPTGTTSCQYVQDKADPVNVKVPISVFGVARVEQTKTVQVHEKMVEPTKLMFEQLLEIRKGVDKVQKTTLIIRVLNTLSTIASVHNMIMLSRNLATTAGDATSAVINAIGRISGVIDKDQELIDVNEIVGKEFNKFMEEALGKELWTGTKITWKKYSSIYSSASMMLMNVRSMMDSARSIAEWTAQNTGRIGNALKRFGVVGDNAYPWMSESVGSKNKFDVALDKYRMGVENMDDKFSSIESVAGESLDIKEESENLKEQKENFDKQLKEATPITAIANDPIAELKRIGAEASKGKETEDKDLDKDD